MNRLHPWKFGLAAAATFAALNVLCALAVVAAPEATIAVFNTWFHGLDLRMLAPSGGKAVTAAQVVAGAISAALVSFVGGAILACVYNMLAGTGWWAPTTMDGSEAP